MRELINKKSKYYYKSEAESHPDGRYEADVIKRFHLSSHCNFQVFYPKVKDKCVIVYSKDGMHRVVPITGGQGYFDFTSEIPFENDDLNQLILELIEFGAKVYLYDNIKDLK